MIEYAIVIPLVLLPLTAGVVNFGVGMSDHALRVQVARLTARDISEAQSRFKISDSEQLLAYGLNRANYYLSAVKLDPANYSVNIEPYVISIAAWGGYGELSVWVSVSPKEDLNFFSKVFKTKSCAGIGFRLVPRWEAGAPKWEEITSPGSEIQDQDCARNSGEIG